MQAGGRAKASEFNVFSRPQKGGTSLSSYELQVLFTAPIDLLNLKNNVNNGEKDFNLAFLASGDLGNVMKTINSPPPTLSGSPSIVLNDPDADITFRTALVLGRQLISLHTLVLSLPSRRLHDQAWGIGDSFKHYLGKIDLPNLYPLDGGDRSCRRRLKLQQVRIVYFSGMLARVTAALARTTQYAQASDWSTSRVTIHPRSKR